MTTNLHSYRACPTGAQAEQASAAAPEAAMTLQGVVERALLRHATSARGLSRIAALRGLRLSHTTVNKIRNGAGPLRPADDVVRALAALADMDEGAVFRIAGTEPAVPDPEQESTGLRGMVHRACEIHGASGRQLALMAQRKGFTITPATVNRVRSGTYPAKPGRETVRALAWLAGVNEDSAFRMAEIPTLAASPADESLPELDGLPAKAREAAMRFLQLPVAS